MADRDDRNAHLRQFFTALERIPLLVQHPKEITMTALATALTPPLADPTRPPRRTENPRLRVRSVAGAVLQTLPASDPRNLTEDIAGLYEAEWEIWFLDENGQEQMLGYRLTPGDAFEWLPDLMRIIGLLNEDGTRPASEGGAFHAA